MGLSGAFTCCSRLHLRLQHVLQVNTVRLALPIHRTPWFEEGRALARPPRGVERRRRGVAIGVPVLVVKVLPHHRPFLGPRRRCGGHCIRGNRLFVPQIYPIAFPPSELLLYCLLQTQAQHKRKCAHKVRDRGSKLHHKKLTPVRRSTAPASSSLSFIIYHSLLQSFAHGRSPLSLPLFTLLHAVKSSQQARGRPRKICFRIS